jgi:tripartite-type tricarboxylate transporter receptor subunit TctC
MPTCTPKCPTIQTTSSRSPASPTIIGLAAPVSLNVNTMKEFVAKVRAEPGKLNYASVTGANDLLFASFLKTEKLEMAKVPYKDTVQAVNDLTEGRIHAYVGAYAIQRPHVMAGKIKVLPSPI